MRSHKPSSKRRLSIVATTCLFATSLPTATSASAAITINSDPILFWNDLAISLVTTGPAPVQAYTFAMANIAMHDAVNATLGGFNKSHLSGVTSVGGDSRAAAARAAHDVLVARNGANAGAYATALANSLALIPDGAAKTNGIATGAAYATAMIANRVGDGSAVVSTYTTTGLPGDYRLTPGVAAAAVPAWGNVRPFVLSSVNDVPVGPPPALGSAEYAAAYNEVKEIGALNSLTRTLDQKNSALFWDVSNGGTWIRVGLTIAEDEGLSTLGLASVFSLLSTGLADSAIAVWDAKYDYRLWRPITAIQLGDTDGNALTEKDAGWNSLFNAPGHPSYISAHSALSSVGSTILQSFFGDDEAFSFNIGPDSRSFTGLAQAELDAANSRLWGGIHFRFDNDAGLALGRQVGNRALRAGAFAPVPEPSSWAMMIAGFAVTGLSLRGRTKRVAHAA